jgi:integrase/recombinase XerD
MSVTLSNPKPISPLRARMIEDMTVRNFGAATQREYIRAVKKLACFLGGRSLDTASAEELRAFQLHLSQTGTNPPTMNATVTALWFFFKTTIDRPDTTRHLVFVHEPKKLPRVLSPEEVLRLLEAAPNAKYKAALAVAYGAGLRAMEVVSLKVSEPHLPYGSGAGGLAQMGFAPRAAPLFRNAPA